MSDTDRFVTPSDLDEDQQLELSLRPRSFREYVGQVHVVENLRISVQAALERGESLDHVLVHGPPGLGKTTLAHVVAREMGTRCRTTSGPAVDKAGDLAAILTNMEPGDVLFVDEIHRLPTVVEETLYPAIEDFRLDVIVGQGPSARTVELELPPFTLIGATTRLGLLTAPLRARFGIVHHLDYYREQDLFEIVNRSASILAVEITEEGARELARRSRGTPRIANRLLKRVRDFAQVRSSGIIDEETARAGLESLEVDVVGLDRHDRRVLKIIAEKFSGGPVGLSTLAAAVGEEKDTLEEVLEPYLIQIGFLERTPRGRCVTNRGLAHLGLKGAGDTARADQGTLFRAE